VPQRYLKAFAVAHKLKQKLHLLAFDPRSQCFRLAPAKVVIRSSLSYHGTSPARRSRKIVRGLKEGLTEQERFAVADHVVAQLTERGGQWRLNDEAPTAPPPST
jgi:hypothetical protein